MAENIEHLDHILMTRQGELDPKFLDSIDPMLRRSLESFVEIAVQARSFLGRTPYRPEA
jgi:hypothetical protein